jgi:hypothetical protein
MQSEEDVIMTDEQVPTTATNITTTTTTTTASPSQTRRTDHDWQPLYVPTAPVARGQPHGSQNLISLFHLDGIAASVRRTDPKTGEKINKIRKSYEGKVKQLHIAGINKADGVKNEFIFNGGILDIPQDVWHATKVAGNPVSNGMTASLLAKLDRAVAMAPGPLPRDDSERYKKLIGTDEAPKAKVADALKKVGGAIANGAQTGVSTGIPSPNMRPAVRPARQNSKRSYHDSTFTGYGEGFADEDGNHISEEESRARGLPMAKKRRTDRKVGMIRFFLEHSYHDFEHTKWLVALPNPVVSFSSAQSKITKAEETTLNLRVPDRTVALSSIVTYAPSSVLFFRAPNKHDQMNITDNFV